MVVGSRVMGKNRTGKGVFVQNNCRCETRWSRKSSVERRQWRRGLKDVMKVFWVDGRGRVFCGGALKLETASVFEK